MNKPVLLIVITLLTSCFTRERLSVDSEFLWSKQKHASKWTRWTIQAIKDSALLQQSPVEIKQFCPKYNLLNETTKVKFWVVLISAMAKFESHFNTNAQYTEKFKDQNGNLIISRGLLQISKESANQKRYQCNIGTENELHNPQVNLTCGIKILSYWVNADGAIAYSNGKNTGGARYWSVLRPINGVLNKIKAHTKSLDFCKDTS